MAILITDFNGEDNVMVFTESVTAKEVEKALRHKGQKFSDVVEVKDEEVGFYCYEPLWDFGTFSRNVKRCCAEADELEKLNNIKN